MSFMLGIALAMLGTTGSYAQSCEPCARDFIVTQNEFVMMTTPYGVLKDLGVGISLKHDVQTHEPSWYPYEFIETLGVASGDYDQTCGLRPDGGVECWTEIMPGWTEGLTVNAPTTTGNTVLSLGGSLHDNVAACVITSTGGVDCWGEGVSSTGEPTGTGFTDVGTGLYSSCAVQSGSTVAPTCWGSATNSVITDLTSVSADDYVAVSVSWDAAAAVTSSGDLVIWGNDGDDLASVAATSIGSDVIDVRLNQEGTRIGIAWHSDHTITVWESAGGTSGQSPIAQAPNGMHTGSGYSTECGLRNGVVECNAGQTRFVHSFITFKSIPKISGTSVCGIVEHDPGVVLPDGTPITGYTPFGDGTLVCWGGNFPEIGPNILQNCE